MAEKLEAEIKLLHDTIHSIEQWDLEQAVSMLKKYRELITPA